MARYLTFGRLEEFLDANYAFDALSTITFQRGKALTVLTIS